MSVIRGRELTEGVVQKISIVTRPANRTPFRIIKADVPYWSNPVLAKKKDFSTDKRKALAKQGKALPDGSFPIEDKNDLENAIHDVGRADDPAKAKAHIKARAKDLGAEDMLPDGWKSGGKKAEATMSIFDRLSKVMFKAAEPPKAVAYAVAVAKSADTNATRLRVKSVFKADAKIVRVENDTHVVYKLAGSVEGEQDVLLQIDPDFAVVVSNVKKGLYGETAVPATFAERVVDNCVMPGISQALDTMTCTLWAGLMQANSPSEAVAKMDEVFTDAKAYLSTLIGAIPSEAFKAESGGKMTLDLGDYNTVIRFPMEPTKKDPNSGTGGVDGGGNNGGSKGVDPDDGDIEGGTDAQLPGKSGLAKKGEGDQGITFDKDGSIVVKAAAADDDSAGVDADDAPANLKGGARQIWADNKNKANKKKGIGGTKDGYTPADTGNRKSKDGVIDGEDGKGGGDRPAKKFETDVMTAIASIATDVKKMSTELATVQGSLKDTKAAVTKNEEGLKRVAGVLKSTVVVEPDGDEVQKGDNDDSVGSFGLIDTAYDRKFITEKDDKAA